MDLLFLYLVECSSTFQWVSFDSS
ncbi:hypothetical protein Zm00014a_041805 [Zea mays]|uniref:Uncharacterized protein n=1 Tax=Zea mays TaxID=4577 RepID=A0A317YF07_MAIZE|nr:hypothetical protein Zm00014a_041805 [Zea mays]